MRTHAMAAKTALASMPITQNNFCRSHHGGHCRTEMSPGDRIKMRKDLARQASPATQVLPVSIKQTPVMATLLPFCKYAKSTPGELLSKYAWKMTPLGVWSTRN